jgi:ribosomal protein S18
VAKKSKIVKNERRREIVARDATAIKNAREMALLPYAPRASG